MNEPAAEVKHRVATSLWLVVNYNEDMPYRVTLDIGSEKLPIIGHGHHNLTWIIADLIKERDRFKMHMNSIASVCRKHDTGERQYEMTDWDFVASQCEQAFGMKFK